MTEETILDMIKNALLRARVKPSGIPPETPTPISLTANPEPKTPSKTEEVSQGLRIGAVERPFMDEGMLREHYRRILGR